MVQALRADFLVVTPLFLGGADMDTPEIRVPSIKGALRFWLRAIDPAFHNSEPRLFGGAGDGLGQSAVLLRIDPPDLPTARLPDFATFNPRQFNVVRGHQTRNGLVYLGYPFQMRGNRDRRAIPAGTTFTLRCLLPRITDDTSDEAKAQRRGLVAALWLLGHFGGLGSRARRGFGGLALTDWGADDSQPPIAGGSWPELEALPLVATATGFGEANARLNEGLATLWSWFPREGWSDPQTSRQHPHLGRGFRARLVARPVPQREWDRGLADMGEVMQTFRADMARRDPGNTRRVTPARATFGLPLIFRYPQRGGRSITIVPHDAEENATLERQGSLLFLHLLATAQQVFPLWVRLDGAVPGITPRAAIRGERNPLLSPEGNAMDEFFQSLR